MFGHEAVGGLCLTESHSEFLLLLMLGLLVVLKVGTHLFDGEFLLPLLFDELLVEALEAAEERVDDACADERRQLVVVPHHVEQGGAGWDGWLVG